MAATVFCNIISLGLPWPQAFPSRLTWNIHGNWWQIPDIFPSFRHLKLTSFLWPLIPSFPLQISRKTCRTHRPLFPQMSPSSFSVNVTDLFFRRCHRPLFPQLSPTSFATNVTDLIATDVTILLATNVTSLFFRECHRPLFYANITNIFAAIVTTFI